VAEVAIVGRPDDPATRALVSAATAGYRPNQVTGAAADDAAAAGSAIALLHDRLAVDGRATAYVCRAFACRLPVSDPAGLAEQLADVTAVA
jgi:uncharacterized protein YyaL (SSP411 family)